MSIRNMGAMVMSAAALITLPAKTHAVDSASFELGNGSSTQIARVGLQWNWQRQWRISSNTHISGYWDMALAQWRADRYHNVSGSTQYITDVGITPVFRFQRNTSTGLYAEAGIGAHFLSDHYDSNGRRLSTNFQFGDHLGVGYTFENKLDVGLRFQHFSNGGIKEPNNGINFRVVRFTYSF